MSEIKTGILKYLVAILGISGVLLSPLHPLPGLAVAVICSAALNYIEPVFSNLMILLSISFGIYLTMKGMITGYTLLSIIVAIAAVFYFRGKLLESENIFRSRKQSSREDISYNSDILEKNRSQIDYFDIKIEDYKYLTRGLLDITNLLDQDKDLAALLQYSSKYFKGTGYVLKYEDRNWVLKEKHGRGNVNVENFNFQSGILKDVIMKKKMLYVENIDSDFHYTFINGIKTIKSTIVFPILVNYQVEGLLKWDFAVPTEFEYHKIKIIQTLVHFTSLNLSLLNTLEELEKVSIIDELTQIYNKKEFDSRLKDFVKTGRNLGKPLSLLMIDIDHFKQVNDTYGHLDGDLVLSQLSALLKKYVRISDIIFRYGGEEFTVILPDTSENDAAILAKRLCKSVEENTFYLKKKRIRLTVTVGISELTNEIYTPKMMIETADSALYWGKENGRNRVICYSEIKEKR